MKYLITLLAVSILAGQYLLHTETVKTDCTRTAHHSETVRYHCITHDKLLFTDVIIRDVIITD
jgi:hypothetical protein